MVRHHPISLFPNKECNRRNAGGDHTPPPGLVSVAAAVATRGLEGCRMRRNPSPANRSRKAKLVQPFGIIVGDATCQHLPLPGVGGNLKTLQLAKHFKGGAFALDLRSGSNVLPSQQ